MKRRRAWLAVFVWCAALRGRKTRPEATAFADRPLPCTSESAKPLGIEYRFERAAGNRFERSRFDLAAMQSWAAGALKVANG